MIIDAHAHVGDAMFFDKDLPVDQIVSAAEEAGIERIVVSNWKALNYDMEEGNKELAGWIKRFPGRLYGYVSVSSPRFGQRAIDEINRGLNDYGMVGVKVFANEQFPLYEPCMMDLLAYAAELGVPVLAHTAGRQSALVAEQLRNLKLVMSHMGNTLDPGRGDWHWAIAAAKKYPNIYLETCGSSPTQGFIEAAVDAIGPERILFGTDLPVFDPHVQVAKVQDAEISSEAKAMILGGNAARLFGLTT